MSDTMSTNGLATMPRQAINGQRPQLPTIHELRSAEGLELLAKQNELNVLLNETPPEGWIKVNKYAGNSKYIPINRLEWLMTRIFVNWYTEVRETILMANSVSVTVRVHYQNPVTGEWRWQDGVGASNLQTNANASATDFNALKSNAVEMGLPKAKTEAIKDAIGDLGRLFGRDLNRKDDVDYRQFQGSIDRPLSAQEREHLEERLALSGMNAIDLCGFLELPSLNELSKIHYAKALARINDRITYNSKD